LAKSAPNFACQSCGALYSKWSGRCEACGEWNTIVEEASRDSAPKGMGGKRGRAITFQPIAGQSPPIARRITGNGEFDRVSGGGLVPGSAILIGGDPGIGKSTLLLQIANAVAAGAKDSRVAYITGEESVEQVQMRAKRLDLAADGVELATATNVRDIVTSLDRADPPAMAVIDSIQTMYLATLDSAPGTVAQVRGAAAELIRLAKRRGFALVLVGHVTKEGQIAGPRVLEHMVDTVLYFEGERGHQFRILRAVKNRFGPANEIGVFEMTDAGLMGVENPSFLFLGERREDASGTAVFAGLEGTRPVLVEIQALVAPSALATPRRAVVGWDSARLAMLLAVLEARCGLVLAGKDVYLNVAGGLRIVEPGADLAVAAALVSAAVDRPVPADMVFFGEVGLGGEVRAVSQPDLRLREAAKLGFARACMPQRTKARKTADGGLVIEEMRHLNDLTARIAATGPRAMRQNG
jgi:DNA repair protein RadA/Sms